MRKWVCHSLVVTNNVFRLSVYAAVRLWIYISLSLCALTSENGPSAKRKRGISQHDGKYALHFQT